MDEWASVRRLCDRALASLPELASGVTGRVRADLPEYAMVPRDEHLADVAELHRRRIKEIAERRPPDATDLELVVTLAHHRARQGIPIEVLLGSYHVGDRELWRTLCDLAGDALPVLPSVAALMMESLHVIGAALSAAHGDITRAQQGHRITLSQRFVELLEGRQLDAETERIADALDFDPQGEFIALLWRRVGDQSALSRELEDEMTRSGARIAYAYNDLDVHLVAQGTSLPNIVGIATGNLADGQVGVGMIRGGLVGAMMSLCDARFAIAATSKARPVARFADVWPYSCVAVNENLIEPLIAGAVETARAHPHLAEAVLAYASSDMSVARTAKGMHLHANTVTYRLERWTRLVSWDPRTFDGLTKSLIACRLA
ncbi:helix-turn-helix domain-containing protein [Rhodococcus opacus]|uniref:Putative CdaR family transcriptional regulator n=1 Tax=Rhodococcus opacus (strain B4) TaxID=632772 RepID=C1B667_RHOOB|nr:helix-turn-helix domain-containing protein [Rhodococcus opacus]BAH55478.1 putative CdaR family transcriptional regulator [Rhodococcus opacus B4]